MSISGANPTTFNSIELSSIPGLTVLRVDPYKLAKRSLTVYEIARTNKSKINSGFYNEKNIVVKVGITMPTRDLLEISIDALYALLHDLEGTLVVKQSNGYRSYTATLADAPVTRDGGSYIEIDLIFSLSDRFGYDLTYTTLLQLNAQTAASKTSAVTVEGSAPTQAPIITITISALTGGTGANVVLTNDLTGQAITINRAWVAGDVLIIDSLTKTVKVNGVEVTYTGAIPEWIKGAGFISYTDTLSTRTYTMSVRYLRRWS